MSMSTLQAQLAALNSNKTSSSSSSNQNVGAGMNYASNRHHNDRVGRGVHYSVHHGHSVHNKNSQIHFQPTIVYESMKVASDIPAAMIQQQFTMAIQQFITWDVYPNTLQKLHDSLINKDGDSPGEEKSSVSKKKSIQQLLLVVTCLLFESESEQHEYYPLSLHLLEYLVRFYSIHVNNAIELLWCVLPISQLFPKLVHRCLMLCDWANHQSYLWVRPFCVEVADHDDNSAAPKLPSQTLISISMMKHTDILRTVCNTVVQQLLQITVYETVQTLDINTASDGNDVGNSIHRQRHTQLRIGMSRLLSFTVKIIVNGLHDVQKQTYDEQKQEAIVRVLIQIFCMINRQHHRNTGENSITVSGASDIHDQTIISMYPEEFVMWGYVIVSTLVETIPLSKAVIDMVCIKIVQNLSGLSTAYTVSPIDTQESYMNAITCLLSILFPKGNVTTTIENGNNIENYISIIPTKNTNRGNDDPDASLLLGCYYLSYPIYKAVMKYADPTILSNALGLLLQAHIVSSNKTMMIVASFIGALIGHSFTNSQSHNGSVATNPYATTTSSLIVALLQNKDLYHLWANTRLNLITSVVVVVINCALATAAEDRDTGIIHTTGRYTISQYHSILLECYHVDKFATERGIASTLLSINAIAGTEIKHQKPVLESILNGLVNIASDSITSLDSFANSTIFKGTNCDSNDFIQLLPPYVALEHNDPDIRLNAIRTIRAEVESNLGNINSKNKILNKNDAILERFLRQVNDDSNIEVRSEILNSLDHWFKQGYDVVSMNEENTPAILNLTMNAVNQFYTHGDINNPDAQRCLSLLAFIARNIARFGQPTMLKLWFMTLEMLVGVLASIEVTNTSSLDFVAGTILIAFECDESKDCKNPTDSLSLAKQCLCDCDPFILHTQQSLVSKVHDQTTNSTAERNLRRKSALYMSQILNNAANRDEEIDLLERKRFANFSLTICVEYIESAAMVESISKVECSIISTILVNNWDVLGSEINDRIPELIIKIASTSCDILWTCIAASAIAPLSGSVKCQQEYVVSPYVVLFEAAFRAYKEQGTGNSRALIRILSEIKMIMSKDSEGKNYPCLAIIPTLGLLSSSVRNIRNSASNIIREIKHHFTSLLSKTMKKKKLDLQKVLVLKEMCDQIPSAKASAKLDESKFLSTFLASCIRNSSDPSLLRTTILTLCFFSATSVGNYNLTTPLNDQTIYEWLPFYDAFGGCYAAAIVLDSTELAGEETFPLADRWKGIGYRLVDRFLKCVPDSNWSTTTVHISAMHHLSKSVVRMLKGQAITDPILIVTTGPRVMGAGSGSGRSRSYSLSKMDGISVLNPYPVDMIESLLRILTEAKQNSVSEMIANDLFIGVLNSATWGELVYKNLPKTKRIQIASGVLAIVQNEALEGVDCVPAGIPLSSTDILELLTTNTLVLPQRDFILITYVRTHVATIAKNLKNADLCHALFNALSRYLASGRFVDGIEFVTNNILFAISDILKACSKNNLREHVNDPECTQWTKTLLDICRVDSRCFTGEYRPTMQTRGAALTLIIALCTHFPLQVVPVLIQASIYLIETNNDSQSSTELTAKLTFSKTIPVFLKYAPVCNLSLTDLFSPLSEFFDTLDVTRKRKLYTEFAATLSRFFTKGDALSNDKESNDKEVLLGALLVFFLAHETSRGTGDIGNVGTDITTTIEFALGMLDFSSDSQRLTTLLLLIKYTVGLISKFHAEHRQHDLEKNCGLLPTLIDVGNIAVLGSYRFRSDDTILNKLHKPSNRKSIRMLIIAILSMVCEILSLPDTRELISEGNSNNYNLLLRLWQDMLLLQSATHLPTDTAYHDDGLSIFQVTLQNLVRECRETLQNGLPSQIFVASVTSLLNEGGTAAIQSQALRLVADRVASTDSNSSEALLFYDVVPTVNNIIKAASTAALDLDHTILIQSALLVLEHISRMMSNSLKKNRKGLQLTYLVDGFRHCTHVLHECSIILNLTNDTAALVGDLFSTAAVCCSTLVREITISCVSMLPMLMKGLLKVLNVTNVTATSMADATDLASITSERMKQLAIVRCLLAIVETVPQFLPPFLLELLKDLGLLSSTLQVNYRHDSTVSQLEEIVEKLYLALSTGISARLLIPATNEAKAACTDANETLILLNIAQRSTEHASNATVVTLKNDLLEIVTTTFEDQQTWDDQKLALATAAIDLFLAMVMKLSEIQLCRLYIMFRDWRGDLKKTEPSVDVMRRFGFWTVSARLSQELRSLFLPCLDIIIDDLIVELDILANYAMAKRSTSTLYGTVTKKQKLENNIEYNTEITRLLDPLLATLENALRADAHQGGKWVQARNKDNFESLMEPLGKLILLPISDTCRFPDSTKNNFKNVFGGTNGDECTVIGCLTSLAVAGGNEKIWKSLNNIVVEACGDDHRPDVRRGGLVLLLELVKSLGDEYMGLLPEILPILSELLEDSNEDVASLAREVIALAEEITGESLESSLR